MSEQHSAPPRKVVADLRTWTKQRFEPAVEPDLPIIDTHHHLWDDKPRGRYLIHELAEDTGAGHNILATVFIETGSMFRADGPAAMKCVGEVEFANGVAAMSASGLYGKTRHCAGIVGTADMALGDQAQPVLEALIAAGNGRLRGIRFGTAWDGTDSTKLYGRRNTPCHQLADPTVRKGLARLQPLGLSWDAWMFYPQLPELADVLRALPNTNVILDHSGGLVRMPQHNTNNEAFATWRKHVKELAQYPNLSIKVGGYGMLYAGWDFDQRKVPASSEELAATWRPYVEVCIEAFGVNRCMAESNFPADHVTCSYGVLWNAMKRITQSYSAAEKAAFYRDTAARVYRLEKNTPS